MPYLICPACRLEAYSAAAYANPDRCPRCDASLGHAERADSILHRWKVTDLGMAARQEAVHDGIG
jgi:Zn-finger nucleic acid-binding protein